MNTIAAMMIGVFVSVSAGGIASEARAADGAGAMTPLERVKAVEKGQLKNPLSVTSEIIEEGKQLYQAKTCSACHGATGSDKHGRKAGRPGALRRTRRKPG